MTRHFEFFTGFKIPPISKCIRLKLIRLGLFSIGKDMKFQISKFNSCNTNCFSVYIQFCATANMWALINATVNSPVDEKHNKTPPPTKINLLHTNVVL